MPPNAAEEMAVSGLPLEGMWVASCPRMICGSFLANQPIISGFMDSMQ